MKSQNVKALSIGTSFVLTILAGMPAVADDTELLVVDPSNISGTPPNIMFILDTSGSMGDPVSTTRPYDSDFDYSDGSCDTSRFYWTKLDIEPTCVGDTNTQFIEEAAFLCEDATLRMSGIGAYTGVMVQYRGNDSDDSRWQQLEIGNATSRVECQRDSGVHGDGTTGAVYAQAGTGLPDEFTSDPDAEISWGSGDAAQAYTVYDGNYLNWKENPETANLPKIDIMKAVTKNLMNAIENVNVGLMRFTGSAGGRVLHAVSPIDTDRTAILNKIEGLGAGGATPLAEALYESTLYWRGLDADYGDLQVDPDTGEPIGDIDPKAFVGEAPGTYQSPAMPVCTRNFNVLLTDGMPVDDADDQAKVPLLPGFAGDIREACNGDEVDGRCLDDISEYMYKVDISSTTEGEQVVTTHTIGFDIDLPILKTAAEVSDGDYYLAENVETLTTALMRIIESVVDKGLSFSAPAVAVNTFNRTQNINDLYISTFLPDARVHWPGNLKKYTITPEGVIKDDKPEDAVNAETGFFKDTARSIWTDITVEDGDRVEFGGAANKLPIPQDRNVYTNNGTLTDLTAANNAITPSNATAFSPSDFGLTGATGEPSVEDVIRWARGQDILDDDNDDETDDARNVMGDPLHSQPAAVVYGGDADDPEVVVFTATNDGYFHAVDGETGVELWSFIPKQFLADLPELMLNGDSTYKHYGIDGDIVPVVADLNDNGVIDGTDFVYVIFGLRRGGTEFYALDVTDKDSPELMWTASYPEFGQSWSRPVVARVDMVHADLNALKAVVIIGEGYDTVHDTAAFPSNPDNVGAGISMLDLMSGERLWRAGRSDADLVLEDMTRSIPSQVQAIDFSGDGFVDRLYSVDVGGQVWRFDVFRNKEPDDTDDPLVTGGVIARFGGEGIASGGETDTRRFYSAPDVSIFYDPVINRRFVAIGVGSGYRAHPLDVSAPDAYYSLRDPDLFAKLNQDAYNNYDSTTGIALDGDMAEVRGQVNTEIGNDQRGWKYTFLDEQMMLSSSATFDNSVFFLGYEPNVASAATCQVIPGINYLYRVNVANGDPVANNLDEMTGTEAEAARTTALKQGGIAPTPAFLFPSAPQPCEGDACSPPPIGCVGVECFNPGFANNPVRTLWTQDGIE
ncbi:MAG: PQQ-binding-like beta-propeller repeat protein [Gammaproteobacteria bacterium]|nr:PQQ-binding-like beta-propeller repeat protein [Gammaproteobacteria bacterium]MBT8110135.1 PQQ-binding-like beta-propeller repeat protein [Gammaproteobacteria bacterium]NND47701.1 PQQ-binding-like beta-propeller repeat protein [Woeseiaceae bacterium]NNL44839.1 PQQ-binding-like beta-propeller repeat protein [Woeseiaceae bacterium]